MSTHNRYAGNKRVIESDHYAHITVIYLKGQYYGGKFVMCGDVSHHELNLARDIAGARKQQFHTNFKTPQQSISQTMLRTEREAHSSRNIFRHLS